MCFGENKLYILVASKNIYWVIKEGEENSGCNHGVEPV